MDFERLASMPIIDAHIHFGAVHQIPEVLEMMDGARVSQFNLAVTIHPERVNLNPPAFQFKARYPDRVYVFGSPDYSGILGRPDRALTISLADQVDRLMALGCDGIKTRSGKPTIYKYLGMPMDGEIHADFYARAEERGMPILWHVGDPEEFWDPERIPAWAMARGWLYDESYPTMASLYGQVDRVLARYPRLTVIFAHFYFLSAQLERAAALLDRYPNIHLDIAPGVEMYHNFTAHREATREFFVAYQDRILFGTDVGASAALYDRPHMNIPADLATIWMVRTYLETEEAFAQPLSPATEAEAPPLLRGLALPPDVLTKIYAGNFRRIVGPAPRPLDMALMEDELKRLAALAKISSS